jgi:hypothetical protein
MQSNISFRVGNGFQKLKVISLLSFYFVSCIFHTIANSSSSKNFGFILYA